MLQQIRPPFLVLIVIGFLFLCCNSKPADIPFPREAYGIKQPQAVPLIFSNERKLTWDTINRKKIVTVERPLDIDKLPLVFYDTSLYKPFNNIVTETPFDVEAITSQPLDLAKLTSTPLQFTSTSIAPPPFIKTALPALQQGRQFSIADLGQSQGMPARIITCLAKDKYGLMWISAGEGLFRYDGNHVQSFIPGQSSSFINGIAIDTAGRVWFVTDAEIGYVDPVELTVSRSSQIASTKNNINKITKDVLGRLWLNNAKGKGVSIIDPNALSFKTITKKQGLADTLAFEITAINDHEFWATTTTGGVNRINTRKNSIQTINHTNGLRNDTLTTITHDLSGKVYISVNDGGIEVIDNQNKLIRHFTRNNNISRSYYFTLFTDSKNGVWRGSATGLDKIDFEKNSAHHFTGSNGLLFNTVASFLEDDLNRIWVGTLRGLQLMDQGDKPVKLFSNYSVSCTTPDTKGNLWVGTENGLIIVNTSAGTARYVTTAQGLINNFIQSITRIDNKMFVSCNGGLNIFDFDKKTIATLNSKTGLGRDTIYNVIKDKRGRYWLSGPQKGIEIVDFENNLVMQANTNTGLSENVIQDVRQDTEGNVWLATVSKGIDIIDPSLATVKSLNNQPGLKDTCNRMMLADVHGRIWIGTDKGLYVADIKKQQLTIISKNEGLTNNVINSVVGYNDGVVASTLNGISIITPPSATDSAGWLVQVLNKSENLMKQTLSWATDNITSDGKYIFGDQGISIINEIRPAFLPVATYITGLSIMTENRRFMHRNLSNEQGKRDTTKSAIDRGRGQSYLSAANKEKISWDSTTGAYNLPVNLQIPYNRNYLQFQFIQANLSRSDTTFYSYLLDGIDKTWSPPTTNTSSENYLNLSPGTYNFKVGSKGANGEWSEPAIFSFTITQPWYNKWWAWLLYLLVGGIAIKTYVVYRQKKLKEENRLLEEKIKLRTKELEESISNLQSTQQQLIYAEKMASLGELTAGIAHEIQNPLNFINNFSEINQELLGEMNEAIAQNNLDELKVLVADLNANEGKINHHGKRADSIVKGMLQHSRVTTGTKDPVNINALADEYLRLSYHGLRAKDKSFNAKFEMHFDDNIKTIEAIGQDLGRVLLNLYNNAFYAVADKKKTLLAQQQLNGYEPEVSVTTKKTGNTITISIRDNGNGIPQKLLDKIFQPFFTTKPTGQGTGLGLSLSYDIIKAHGGEIKVHTNQGEGTEFIIKLPA